MSVDPTRAALAGLLAALPRCALLHDQDDETMASCGKPARFSGHCDAGGGIGWACTRCRCATCQPLTWADEVEAAERALATPPAEPDTCAADKELSRWFREYEASVGGPHAHEIAISQLRKAIRRQEAEKDPEQRTVVQNLKRDIRNQQQNNERRNLQLDALGLVWCSGGCDSGAHRWDDSRVTEVMVAEAERNTARLRQWFNSRKQTARRQP